MNGKKCKKKIWVNHFHIDCLILYHFEPFASSKKLSEPVLVFFSVVFFCFFLAQPVCCQNAENPNLLPLVVGQRDALWGHLEVHSGGSRWHRCSQCLRYGLGDGLRARQGLHLYRADVEHIACWEEKNQMCEMEEEKKIPSAAINIWNWNLNCKHRKLSPAVDILTLVQHILSCTCTFFFLFHAVWSKAWHWAMGLGVEVGEGEGADRVRKSSGEKKSLQIIPNKNILLVISTKLDIQVNKTNPKKKKMHLQIQEITPPHLCRLRHAATHNKQTRCTFQIKDFFFFFS